MTPTNKLHPRNRVARNAMCVAGNPITTELQAGVGNCFPGLEFDTRNLDRRFFPYLVVDFINGAIVLSVVELDRAQADRGQHNSDKTLADLIAGLETLVNVADADWQVHSIEGDFVGYGHETFAIADLGPDPTKPVDGWTAVRLLQPETQVILKIGAPGQLEVTVSGARASYLTDDGAFAEMFAPGELTQSLCSPWTHDFRDCGCFYWASNHPDLVQPALPAAVASNDPKYDIRVQWERSDRVTSPPKVDPERRQILDHYEINTRWHELDVVLDGREQRTPYRPAKFTFQPVERDTLMGWLRYGAGVELAAMLEYLAAAYSLNMQAGEAKSMLHGDVVAAHYQLLRIAASEMRHLKAVNGLLLNEHTLRNPSQPFQPALGRATVVPEADSLDGRPVTFEPLTSDVLKHFIKVEAPLTSVDALYGRIRETYRRDRDDASAATVDEIIAEGADHYQSFLLVQEWLDRHEDTQYLITNLKTPAPDAPVLDELQQRYQKVLDLLYTGYQKGMPRGGTDIAQARHAMLGPDGVQGECENLAAQGQLPVFAVPRESRFAEVPPPQ
jgi:hypothetical protein